MIYILEYGSHNNEFIMEMEKVQAVDKKYHGFDKNCPYDLTIIYGNDNASFDKYEFTCSETQISNFISEYLKFKGYLKQK